MWHAEPLRPRHARLRATSVSEASIRLSPAAANRRQQATVPQEQAARINREVFHVVTVRLAGGRRHTHA